MASVLVVGGGICGLGTALLLARDGHEVTLFERDTATIAWTAGQALSAEQAWSSWERAGVAQFRQPHNFMPGLRRLLEAELPDVQERPRRSGASRFDFVHPLPPSFTDRSARPIDDELWTWTARRPVGEPGPGRKQLLALVDGANAVWRDTEKKHERAERPEPQAL